MGDKVKKAIKVKSTEMGRGVFARRKISRDEVVGEIEGKILGVDFESDYCMDLDGKGVLEPEKPFRFLNHSCEPNSELLLWKTRKHKGKKYPRIWLRAIKKISRGDELTIDYGWPAEKQIRCLCGQDNCRGWIADADELASMQD